METTWTIVLIHGICFRFVMFLAFYEYLIVNKLLYLPFIFKVLFVNCQINLLSLIKLFVTATFHHDFVICLVSFWWFENKISHKKSIWRVVEIWCFALKCAQDQQLLRRPNEWTVNIIPKFCGGGFNGLQIVLDL